MGIIKIKYSKKELLNIISSTEGEYVTLDVKIEDAKTKGFKRRAGARTGYVASLKPSGLDKGSSELNNKHEVKTEHVKARVGVRVGSVENSMPIGLDKIRNVFNEKQEVNTGRVYNKKIKK